MNKLFLILTFLVTSCGGSQLFVEAGITNFGIEQTTPIQNLTGEDFIWSEYNQSNFNYKWQTQPFVTIKYRQFLFDGKKYQTKNNRFKISHIVTFINSSTFIYNPKFVFCIAGGSNSDGGFKIYSQRPDGSDQMTLNANNAKSGW